jgi:TorA maturation chaperone TorD
MNDLEMAEGYRVLAVAFRHPAPALLRDELAGVAAVAGESSMPALSELAADLAVVAHEGLPGEYNRLFAQSGAARGNETSFVRADKGARIGQLAVLYRAFGARAGGAEHEAPDFVGAELEFAALLHVKAVLAGDEERTVTRRALQILLEEHLGAWLPLFAANMRHVSDDPFYLAAADRACAWIEADLAGNGWTAQAVPRSLGVVDDPESEFGCAQAT